MAFIWNGILTPKFDHELFTYACDPNFQDISNVDSIREGPYSAGAHSLYGKTMAQYATKSAISFFRAYKDQPKMFSFQFVEGHEVSGEVIAKIDDPLADFLELL